MCFSLEILYLGGNCLTEIPADIGYLGNLSALSLCDNQLQTLPPTLLNLQRLKSLALHNNLIAVLPPQIIALDLVELSLRNNPLVANFVRDMVFEPPSLLELAGRVVKVANLPYMREELPSNLVEYLNMAQKCVNPKCKGERGCLFHWFNPLPAKLIWFKLPSLGRQISFNFSKFAKVEGFFNS